MFGVIFSCLYWYFRPLIKWFLRKTTKLCELQRICYGEPAGGPRTLAIETSLKLSKCERIREFIRELDAASDCQIFKDETETKLVTKACVTVLQVKKVNPKVHLQFVKSFNKCVEQIWGYKQLLVEVEELRTTLYNSDSFEHEEKLLELWDRLMPDEKLTARVTKQWQDIGFQGDDPKTDFRGMGLLGLENLLYFATEYEGPARHVLSHSYHPIHGYAFAIVGINLTSMAYHLLRDGTAKTHIYNAARSLPNIKTFHQFYCYLFYEFDRYWIASKPKNMMDFSIIKEKFEQSIRVALENPLCLFRVNISVDNI